MEDAANAVVHQEVVDGQQNTGPVQNTIVESRDGLDKIAAEEAARSGNKKGAPLKNAQHVLNTPEDVVYVRSEWRDSGKHHLK